jgi:ankyrin repeat protein
VDAREHNGATSLHFAALRGHPEVAKLLLAKNADPNIKSRSGGTSLHMAAMGRRANLSELPQRLAEEEAKNYGSDQEYLSSVKLPLSHGAQLEARDDHGWTPLHFAASAHEKAIVELLLQWGADAQAKTLKGYTPLHLLENSPEDLEVARLLIAHKANLEATNGDGNTALHVAVVNRYPALASALLAAGAKIDAHGQAGATPLHWAATEGDADLVSLLLKYHADVNSRDLYRFTPLMQAAMLGRKTVAELLLSAGAAIDLEAPTPDESTVTALSLALSAGQFEIADLLRQHGAKK